MTEPGKQLFKKVRYFAAGKLDPAVSAEWITELLLIYLYKIILLSNLLQKFNKKRMCIAINFLKYF